MNKRQLSGFPRIGKKPVAAHYASRSLYLLRAVLDFKAHLPFFAVMLCGCSMLPVYERPAAPVPNVWPEHLQLKLSHSVPHTEWQQYFSDPRLQMLISTALANNRDLRIATARIAEARALYGVQQADRLPTLNVGAGRNASLSPASTSFTGKPFQSQRYEVNVSVVSYELDFWGRVSSLNAAAKANYLASEAAQRAFRWSLIASVADAYLSSLELSERLQLTEQTIATRATTRELVARRRELGASSDMDYLQAEGAYQTVLAERANLQRQLAAADSLLDVLIGQPQTELKELPAARSLAEQAITPEQLGGMPAEVLLQRPDVYAAEQKLIAANANIGAARAAFLPRISLTGSLGTASRSLSGLFSGGSEAWSFQPTLSVPLFDAGRSQSNVDVAQARKVIAVAEYEKTLQLAFKEVLDLLTARDRLLEQQAAQQANADAQAQRLKLVEARFNAGVANHLEVLDAQRESYAAAQGLAQVRRASLSAAAQLYQALAGESGYAAPTSVREVGTATP